MSTFHLESLLAPISVEEFFSSYWEKAPLVCARREPSHYQALLGVSEIDFILSSAFTMDRTAVEALGTAEVKKFLKGDSATHISELYDAYRRGSTIRVNRVQRFWKPLRELCRSLEQSSNSRYVPTFTAPRRRPPFQASLRHTRRTRTANFRT